ncbi:MAG: tRNA epoxyqueuosine(34) reductase QueG [Verrucomicrobiota bacterium]
MDPFALKAAIQTEAARLGFDACRFAPAVAPPHADAFKAWLEEGRNGEMAWMAKNADRRTDPQLVLPGAKTVIVVARNYSPVSTPATESPADYAIARYAWGEDYHEVLTPRIRQLETVLEAHGGRQRSYVDTGPMLERDYAALSGLGWHGKSTMLISRDLGAFFFLGAMLTTLELPPDPQAVDRCGSCTRCIDVCPTHAITAPHQLDARLCVSYLTIELKGSIPEELRPLIGNRIYGCDDCAAICPWNRFAQASTESRFAARPFASQWRLRDFLALDAAEFRALFRGSPILRIKRKGFLRNVCVALGNTGDLQDLPALERAAQDPEPLIVEHALWAVKQVRERINAAP